MGERKYLAIKAGAARDFAGETLNNITILRMESDKWMGHINTLWRIRWECCGDESTTSHKALVTAAKSISSFKMCPKCRETLTKKNAHGRAKKRRSPILDQIDIHISDIAEAMARRHRSMREVNAARVQRAHLIACELPIPDEIERLARGA